MSGHSKWSQIKRKKAVLDAKRGAKFTKLIREITVAARAGGGDPEGNPRLRLAIDTAKSHNMPLDNIERAVLKGTGDLEGVSYEEATYEGYGPGGAAILVEVTTDNMNRTVAELRHAFTKHNGNLGAPNSVAWMFDRRGQLYIDAAKYGEEATLEAVLEAGAEDMERDGDQYVVTTNATTLHSVRAHLENAGITPEEAAVAMIPKSTVRVEGKDAEKLLKLMSLLEDNDDVSQVFSNCDIDAETLATAGE
ncbi:MAG: YebC/PmpR family DNA-binding transcriptional regulator [Gemmatimonadetes bacterium]|nr:YebC/PmpR family DNA-binding transcriptional regulator [Gemmatimonadota bacterium]